jgi:hypothetical protein
MTMLEIPNRNGKKEKKKTQIERGGERERER